MGLRWWFLLIPISIGIGLGVYLLYRRSRQAAENRLPLLVRSFRILELPEYQRALRLHNRIAVAALVMSIVVMCALTGAVMRPTTVRHPKIPVSSAPVDIMVCVGGTIMARLSHYNGMPALFTALHDKAKTFKYERVGLTREFYRAFPVTSDLQFVDKRLDEIRAMAQDISDKPLVQDIIEPDDHFLFRREPDPDRGQHRVYASLVDQLAICALGIPALGADSGRGKMILYYGDTNSSQSDQDSKIMPAKDLKRTIKAAGIQVNAINTASGGIGGLVTQLAEESGGRVFDFPMGMYVTTRPDEATQKKKVASFIDEIIANEPNSAPDLSANIPVPWEVPDLALQIALVAALALALCRLGTRQ